MSAAAVVAAGARFEGLLSFRGEARVDGELVGRVRARGRLIVGVEGRVAGEIEVDELVVEGRLEGPVRARERVVLEAGCEVVGDLRSPRFAIADGCRLEGHCTTENARI